MDTAINIKALHDALVTGGESKQTSKAKSKRDAQLRAA